MLAAQPIEKSTDNQPTVIVLGLTGFAPYSKIDEETGHCHGIGFDLTQSLLSSENFKIKPFCAAPARVYRSVSEGKVDFTVNIKSTSTLKGTVSFTRLPFDNLKLNLYSRVENSNNKTVAAIRGYDYEGQRRRMEEQGFRFVDVPDADNATNLFLNARTSHLLSYENPYIHFLSQLDIETRTTYEQSIQTKYITSVPTHYAISKSSPHHDALVEAFNRIDDRSLADQHFINQVIAATK
jgi:polar amino acid transport system substrate-binding protein